VSAIPIYIHEYTITAQARDKMGVQQVVITIVDENKEGHSLEAVESALKFFDQNLNISHKILLTGYRHE
jgi:hypothetical protein